MRKILLLTILLSIAFGQTSNENPKLLYKNIKDLEEKIVGTYKIAEGFFKEELEVDRELYRLILFEDNTLFYQLDFDVYIGTWHFVATSNHSGDLLFIYDSGNNFLLNHIVYQTPTDIKNKFFPRWDFKEDKDFLLLSGINEKTTYIFEKEIYYDKEK